MVDPSEYVLPELQSNSDKEFHQWAGVAVVRYGTLLGAYSMLLDCWEHYKEKQ